MTVLGDIERWAGRHLPKGSGEPGQALCAPPGSRKAIENKLLSVSMGTRFIAANNRIGSDFIHAFSNQGDCASLAKQFMTSVGTAVLGNALAARFGIVGLLLAPPLVGALIGLGMTMAEAIEGRASRKGLTENIILGVRVGIHTGLTLSVMNRFGVKGPIGGFAVGAVVSTLMQAAPAIWRGEKLSAMSLAHTAFFGGIGTATGIRINRVCSEAFKTIGKRMAVELSTSLCADGSYTWAEFICRDMSGEEQQNFAHMLVLSAGMGVVTGALAPHTLAAVLGRRSSESGSSGVPYASRSRAIGRPDLPPQEITSEVRACDALALEEQGTPPARNILAKDPPLLRQISSSIRKLGEQLYYAEAGSVQIPSIGEARVEGPPLLRQYPIPDRLADLSHELLVTYVRERVKEYKAGRASEGDFREHMQEVFSGRGLLAQMRSMQSDTRFAAAHIEAVDYIAKGQGHPDRPVAEIEGNGLDALDKLGPDFAHLPLDVTIEDGRLCVAEEGIGMDEVDAANFLTPRADGNEIDGDSLGHFCMGAKQYIRLLRNEGSTLVMRSKKENCRAIEIMVTRRGDGLVSEMHYRDEISKRGTRVEILDTGIRRAELEPKARYFFQYAQGRDVDVNRETINAAKPISVVRSGSGRLDVALETYAGGEPGLTICAGHGTVLSFPGGPGGNSRRVLRLHPRSTLTPARDYVRAALQSKEQVLRTLDLIDREIAAPQDKLALLSGLHDYVEGLVTQGNACRGLGTALKERARAVIGSALVVPDTDVYRSLSHAGSPILRAHPELLPPTWRDHLPKLESWEGPDPIVLVDRPPNSKGRRIRWDEANRILLVDPRLWQDHPELVVAATEIAGMPEKGMQGRWRFGQQKPVSIAEGPLPLSHYISYEIPSYSKDTVDDIRAFWEEIERGNFIYDVASEKLVFSTSEQGVIDLFHYQQQNLLGPIKIGNAFFLFSHNGRIGRIDFNQSPPRVVHWRNTGVELEADQIYQDKEAIYLCENTRHDNGWIKIENEVIEAESSDLIDHTASCTLPPSAKYSYARGGNIASFAKVFLCEGGAFLKYNNREFYILLPETWGPFITYGEAAFERVLPIVQAPGETHFGPMERDFFKACLGSEPFQSLSHQGQKALLNARALLRDIVPTLDERAFLANVPLAQATFPNIERSLGQYVDVLASGRGEAGLSRELRTLHNLLVYGGELLSDPPPPLTLPSPARGEGKIESYRLSSRFDGESGTASNVNRTYAQGTIHAAVADHAGPEAWIRDLLRFERAGASQAFDATVYVENHRPVLRLSLATPLDDSALAQCLDPRLYPGRRIPSTFLTALQDVAGERVRELRIAADTEGGRHVLFLTPIRDRSGAVIDVEVKESSERRGDAGGTIIEQVLESGEPLVAAANWRADLTGLLRFLPQATLETHFNGQALAVKSSPAHRFTLPIAGHSFDITISKAPDPALLDTDIEIGSLPQELFAASAPDIRRAYEGRLAFSIDNRQGQLDHQIGGKGFANGTAVDAALLAATPSELVRLYSKDMTAGQLPIPDFTEDFFTTGCRFHSSHHFDPVIAEDARRLNAGAYLQDPSYYQDPAHGDRLHELWIELKPDEYSPSPFDLVRSVRDQLSGPLMPASASEFVDAVFHRAPAYRDNIQIRRALELAFSRTRAEASDRKAGVTERTFMIQGNTIPWATSPAHAAFHALTTHLSQWTLDALGPQKSVDIGYIRTPEQKLAEHSREEIADGSVRANGRDHSTIRWNLEAVFEHVANLSRHLSRPYDEAEWLPFLGRVIDDDSHELNHQYRGDRRLTPQGIEQRRHNTHDRYFFDKQLELLDDMGQISSPAARDLYDILKAQFGDTVEMRTEWYKP